jgi:hypothetical protein
VKHSYNWGDVFEGMLAGAFLLFISFVVGSAITQQQAAMAQSNATEPPTISEASKVKLLLAQHDLEQTQLRFAQLQQQFQQQSAQLSTEASKEFTALEALKEAAFTEAHADKASWTLTDKMEFLAAPKRPGSELSGSGSPPTPAVKP